MQRKELVLNGITVLTGLCALAVTIHSWQGSRTGRRRALPLGTVSASEEARLETTGHRIGPAEATLTVVEFGDFQCPVCASYEHTLDTMRVRFPDDFAVVFHHFPLSYHPLAYQLARVAECAAVQGRFTEIHDLIYRKHSELGAMSMMQFGLDAGVPNIREFSRCASDTTSVAVVERDLRDATRLGVPGTPTIIVNGTMHTSDLDVRALSELVRRARRH